MTKKLHIHHLDDNAYDLKKVASALNSYAGLELEVSSFQESNDLLRSATDSVDIYLLDIALSGETIDGLSICKKLRSASVHSVILILSGIESADVTKQAHKYGAHGFIFKSTDETRLVNDIISSYKIAKNKNENALAQQNVPSEISSKYAGSTALQIAKEIPSIINSAIKTIHVKGETGVGKEMVADIVQAYLDKNLPFVRINCAGFNGSTIESELFGHVKGAFTGALKDKAGIFEAANGGWVFLDEISCLSIETQARLLRLLENNEIKRLGENRIRKVNVKIISATNEDIAKLVESGSFREDFRQRLIGKVIEVPPLRLRKNEIPEIVSKICIGLERGPYTISSAAINFLQEQEWKKGNVRELKNCLREMTANHADKHLSTELIPSGILHEMDIFDGSQETVGGKCKEIKAASNIIKIEIPKKHAIINFSSLSNELLWNIIRIYSPTLKRKSIRNLAKITGLSRRAFTKRLQEIIDSNIASVGEVKELIEAYEPNRLRRAY